MGNVPAMLAALRRPAGGGGSTTPTTTCPATGASGTETLHAQSMFHPGLWPGWDMPGGGGTSPESFDGVEESFGPPDTIPFAATIAGAPENPFDAAWAYGMTPFPYAPECNIEVAGGTVELILPDLQGDAPAPNDDGIVQLWILLDGGESSALLQTSIGLGPQTLTGELDAAQATQVAQGLSPGVVLVVYRGFDDIIVSIDAVVTSLDWTAP